MKGQIYNPGQPQKKESFDHSQDSLEEGIRERELDFCSPGILEDSQFGAESIPFEISPDGGLTVRVGTGVAVGAHDIDRPEVVDASDPDKTGGERIVIPVADTASGPANIYARNPGGGPGTGTGTGPFQESPNGLGGWTPTPQSTKTRNIPLVNGALNRIWISYLGTIDQSVTSLHQVETSRILYHKGGDGYDIVVNQSSTPPGGDQKYEFLGTVDLTTSPVLVTSAMISHSGRRFARIRPKRVAVRFEPSALKPTSIANPSTISLEDHINSVGTGVVTPSNVHGLTLNDLGVTQDIDLKSHRLKDHTNGLVVPTESSTTSALRPQTDNSTPVSGDAAMVFLKRLASSETILINGTVYADATVDPAVKLSSPIGSASTGDYFVSFGTSNAAGIYGIVVKEVGSLITVEKRSSPFSLSLETDYLVCTVEWNGTAFINPSPPNVKTDNRVFGTLARRNMQKDAVATTNIQDLAVTTPKLANASVTTSKIVDLNVTSSKLADLSVSSQKLADLSVSSQKLADGSVTSVKMGDDAATSPKIAEADGTTGQNTNTGAGIKTGHLQDDAITTLKIANDAVTSAKIAEADGSTGQDTNSGTGIKTNHLQDGAITGPKLALGLLGNTLSSALVVKSNVATPNSRVDINADLLSIQGTIVSAVNLTADITASGANGLDAGGEAPSTWYAVHVITNDLGTLVASLLSTSATAPTLPGGYTRFRRVGWVRNNASSNFVPATRIGDRVYLDDPTAFTQSFSGNQNTTGLVSFATAIPPTARIGRFSGYCSVNKTSTAHGQVGSSAISVRSGSAFSYWSVVVSTAYNPTVGSHDASAGSWEYALTASQQLDMQISINTAESGSLSFHPTGYIDPV